MMPAQAKSSTTSKVWPGAETFMMPLFTSSEWLFLLVGAAVVLIYLLYAVVQKSFSGAQIIKLRFSPDGRTLFGGGVDVKSMTTIHGWVWAWDVGTGRLLWKQKTEGPTAVLELSPSGDSLLTASMQGFIVEGIWGGAILRNVETGESLFPLTGGRSNTPTTNVYFAPDGQRILGGYKEGIQVWEAHTGERLAFWKILTSKLGWPARLHFSADSRKVLIQANEWYDSSNNTGGAAFTQLREVSTGDLLQDFSEYKSTIGVIPSGVLSADGEWIALASFRFSSEEAQDTDAAPIYWLELWSAKGEQHSQSPELPLHFEVAALSFQPDGNILCNGYYWRAEKFIDAVDFLWEVSANQITGQPAENKETLSSDGRLKAVEAQGDFANRPPLGAIYHTDTGEKLCDLEGVAGR